MAIRRDLPAQNALAAVLSGQALPAQGYRHPSASGSSTIAFHRIPRPPDADIGTWRDRGL